jgi:hypothetical protein
MRPRLAMVTLDSHDLDAAVSGWPNSISLAVCLLPSGDFHFLVLHVSETSSLPRILAGRLGLHPREIVVSPAEEGFHSRPVLFSDTRLVWNLIAEHPQVLEQALDFETNYRFALEEGLDTKDFLSSTLPRSGADWQSNCVRQKPQFVSSRRPRPDLVFQRPRTGSRPIPTLPSFLDKNRCRPKPGFLSARELLQEPRGNPTSTAWLELDGRLIVDTPGASEEARLVSELDDIFFNKDRTQISIRLHGHREQKVTIPRNMVIEPDIIPFNNFAQLENRHVAVKVEVSGWFLVVDFRDAFSASNSVRAESDRKPMFASRNQSTRTVHAA